MYQPCQRTMGRYAAPTTTWHEIYASTLAIGNGKAPNPRTRLVLKSGAKVRQFFLGIYPTLSQTLSHHWYFLSKQGVNQFMPLRKRHVAALLSQVAQAFLLEKILHQLRGERRTQHPYRLMGYGIILHFFAASN